MPPSACPLRSRPCRAGSHRSRQQVAAELNRLDRASNLEARDRATVRLLRADLDLCLQGRTKGSLEAIRQLLTEGKLSRSDVLYAEGCVAAPTSRAALEKLRILLRAHRGHYRGRVALLGLLLARGQLEELDRELRLYTERFLTTRPPFCSGPGSTSCNTMTRRQPSPGSMPPATAWESTRDEVANVLEAGCRCCARWIPPRTRRA